MSQVTHKTQSGAQTALHVPFERKKTRQMCPEPTIHFNVTTSSANLLKDIYNITVVLPGGGSCEGGG